MEEEKVFKGFNGREDNALVQKSLPLRSLSKSDFSLCELKILDLYLARIDSHRPDYKTVKLKKGEIEKLLGVERIRREELSKRIDKLFSPIAIELDTPKGYEEAFRKMVLFEYIDLYKSEADGQWEVELTCTDRAKKAIFNIENIGYFKYKLANIVSLTSRYSYALYMYLENSRKVSWTVTLDKLREEMNCTASTYEVYKRFSDKVLKPACKEINEKTNLRFNCSPIYSGRKVTKILFEITDRVTSYTYDETEKAQLVENPTTETTEEISRDAAVTDFSHIPDKYLTPEQLEIKYGSSIVKEPVQTSEREWK